MELADRVLKENILVHARENEEYYTKHPEINNFFQRAVLKQTINKTIGILPKYSHNILDLGCGTGYIFLEFLKRGFEVIGVDISLEMLNVLEKKIPVQQKARTNLINEKVLDFLKLNNKDFSLISMSAFLHHLFDYEMVLKSACSSLKQGGAVLIFFEPLKQPIQSRSRFFFHNLLKKIDEAIFRISMFVRGMSISEEEYLYSDYQRQFGGIDVNNVYDILKAENFQILSLEKYCARRYGISSLIATRLIRSENTFNIIAVKK